MWTKERGGRGSSRCPTRPGRDAGARGISGGRVDYGQPIQANSDGTRWKIASWTYAGETPGVETDGR